MRYPVCTGVSRNARAKTCLSQVSHRPWWKGIRDTGLPRAHDEVPGAAGLPINPAVTEAIK